MEKEKIHEVATALAAWFSDEDSKPSAIFRLVKGPDSMSVCLMKGDHPPYSTEANWKSLELSTTIKLSQMVLRVVVPGKPLQVSCLIDPEHSVHRERLLHDASLILQEMARVVTNEAMHHEGRAA